MEKLVKIVVLLFGGAAVFFGTWYGTAHLTLYIVQAFGVVADKVFVLFISFIMAALATGILAAASADELR